jgi:hypothetical protein
MWGFWVSTRINAMTVFETRCCDQCEAIKKYAADNHIDNENEAVRRWIADGMAKKWADDRDK